MSAVGLQDRTAQQPQSIEGESQGHAPLAPLQAPIRAHEESFLTRCEKEFGLSREVWGERIVGWMRDLFEHFKTPIDFLDGLSVSRVELPNSNQLGRDAVGHQVAFENRDEKFKQFLSRYREGLLSANVSLINYSPDRPSFIFDPAAHEDFSRQFNSCGCCQTVARAISLGAPSSSPLITANAYPWDPLNMMQTAIRHDSMSNRIQKNESGVYVACDGKTFGAVPTSGWFRSLMKNGDQMRAVAIQNHPLSGMSAPKHLHGQFFPQDLYKAAILRQVIDSYEARLTPSVTAHRSLYHPFDTLVLSSSDTSALAQAVFGLYWRLEEQHLVPTLAYLSGHCFISVQRPSPEGYYANNIGARVLLNAYMPHEVRNWDKVRALYPEPGVFAWENYIQGLAA